MVADCNFSEVSVKLLSCQRTSHMYWFWVSKLQFHVQMRNKVSGCSEVNRERVSITCCPSMFCFQERTWEYSLSSNDKVNFKISFSMETNAEYRAKFVHYHRINGARNMRHIARDKAWHANWPYSVYLCFYRRRNCGIHLIISCLSEECPEVIQYLKNHIMVICFRRDLRPVRNLLQFYCECWVAIWLTNVLQHFNKVN